MLITSASNVRIKEIRKLRERKEQKRSGCFYMEGMRIIGEAFDKQAELQTLVVCTDLLKADFGVSLVDRIRNSGVEVIEVSESVFRSFALKDNPQGLAAVAKARYSHLSEIDASKGIVIALDEVADPGNLGTIVRTADAVDCQGIILLGDTTSPYDPSAIRSSMGAIFSTKVVHTDFDTMLAWKNAQQMQLVGTSDKAAEDYTEIYYHDPVILLMGSEREGLPQYQLDRCDAVARIPMMRSSDSLNLAVATGVMLYEMFNAQRKRTVDN